MSIQNQNTDFLTDLERKLPDLITSSQLVKLNLFGSETSLCKARKKGLSPDYIELTPRRIVYPKAAVLRFFKQRMRNGSIPKGGNNV